MRNKRKETSNNKQVKPEETLSVTELESYVRFSRLVTVFLGISGAFIFIRFMSFLTIGAGYLIDYLLILMVFLFIHFISQKIKKTITKIHIGKKLLLGLATFLLIGFGWDTYLGIRDAHTIISNTSHSKVISYDLTENGRRYFVNKSDEVLEKNNIQAYVIQGGEIVQTHLIDVETSEIFITEDRLEVK